MSDNEYIEFEVIEDENDFEGMPTIAIEYVDGKGYRIHSILNDNLQVAQILSGLAANILENEVNGRNARTHRFFGR